MAHGPAYFTPFLGIQSMADHRGEECVVELTSKGGLEAKMGLLPMVYVLHLGTTRQYGHQGAFST